MATWQFDICFSNSAIPTDDQSWLKTPQPRDNAVRLLVHNLPAMTSWSPNLEQFGNDVGDRVDIYRDEGSISGITVRFDMNEINLRLMARSVEFAITEGATIVDIAKRSLITSTVEDLAEHIRASSAFSFVSDPDNFFKRLAAQKLLN